MFTLCFKILFDIILQKNKYYIVILRKLIVKILCLSDTCSTTLLRYYNYKFYRIKVLCEILF